MELGKLESVPVREVWPHEAHDFTPWLMEHAVRLGEALGIDIEFDESEHRVGGYSLDLLGRDLTNDATLIVENQIETTDHTHLGQVLTYASGTDASTVVWIAAEFRDEHRQAIDWLNSRTDERTHFFGVRVSVVKIGDSVPAPLFDIVAQPNDWQKRAKRVPSQGGRADLYQQFWALYLERVHNEHPDWTKAKVPQRANWMSAPSPLPGTVITPSFAAGNRLRHELYIDTGDAEENTAFLGQLLAAREIIERAYGAPLEWEPLEGKRAGRVADYTEGSIEHVENFDTYITWFIDRGERLRRAIRAYMDASAGRSHGEETLGPDSEMV